MLNFQGFGALIQILPIILKGYGGVFAVTLVIVIAVKILSAATAKKQK